MWGEIWGKRRTGLPREPKYKEIVDYSQKLPFRGIFPIHLPKMDISDGVTLWGAHRVMAGCFLEK